MMDSTTSRASRPEGAQQSEIVFPAESAEREPNEVQPRVTDPKVSFPAEPLAGLNAVAPQQPPAELATTPLWVQRVSLIIYVVFCIELGMLLAVLPWTRVWTDNGLLAGMPALRSIAQQNFVRGIVSGLGLVDVWLGIWEAVHYREKK